jgi:hypothetical protein
MEVLMSRLMFCGRTVRIATGCLLLLAGAGMLSHAGERTDLKKGTRAKTGSVNGLTAEVGNAKWFRFGIVDGNLVNGGLTNSGLLGYHYVSGNPFLSWPKGGKSVEYLHGAVFYVAGQVIGEAGDSLYLNSNNYRRSGVQQSVDGTHWYSFMPLPKFFNNHQTGSVTWDMEGISEDVGEDGLPGTHDTGEGDGKLQPEEDFNRNGKLDISMVNASGWFAFSHKRETWPRVWPQGSYPGDIRQTGAEDPDVRSGRWNGKYGAYVRADQESYTVMDDRENDEYPYYPFADADSRRPFPNGRRGLGLTVSTRSYQWSSPLAEDILITTYDITNNGKSLPKAVVGMYVDPDMGGSLEGDDASFDKLLDITYTWTTGLSRNGLKVGYFGFAFLESPGIDTDGIDNDQDGYVDENQYNHIDENHNWNRYTDLNLNGRWDTEDANHNGVLDPGEDVNGNGALDYEPINDDVGSDGIGPEDEDYPGPDRDGTEANGVPDWGEPDFDFTDNVEIDQVGLTSFYLRDVNDNMSLEKYYWNTEIVPGQFVVKPGFQRDISFSYGCGYVPIRSGEGGSQRYAISCVFAMDQDGIIRNKRTIQVIYDANYNFSKPPRKPVVTFTADDGRIVLDWDDAAERSKDPVYGQDFEAYYVYKSTDPTFESIKTISDAYGNPLLFKPIAIYDLKDGLKGIHPVRLGSNLGPESDLGVSYEMGTDSGLQHRFIDTDVTNGRTYYYAIVSIDKGYQPSFYPALSDRQGMIEIPPTPCSADIQVDLLGRAIGTDKNTVIVTPVERSAGWVAPSLKDGGVTHAAGYGSGSVSIEIYNRTRIVPGSQYEITFGDDSTFARYYANGKTNAFALKNTTTNSVLSYLPGPDTNSHTGEILAEGFKVTIKNSAIGIDTAKTRWTTGSSTLRVLAPIDAQFAVPRDYEFVIVDDSSVVTTTGRRSNVELWDATNPAARFRVPYRYVELASKPLRGRLAAGDRILVLSADSVSRSWAFDVVAVGTEVRPVKGDVFHIATSKNWDRTDRYEFTVLGNDVSTQTATVAMGNIYTVPDPYLTVSSLERKIINESEGRGDRRIDFVNLPAQCRINIFTTSGRLVRVLQHQATENNAREAWDLRTKDGLEVGSGVYLYVVESDGVGTFRGRMAIIK